MLDRLDLRTRFDADGYCFPVRALSEAEALDYRRRYEAFDASPRARAAPDLHNDIYLFKPHLFLAWADALVHDPGVLDVAEALLGPNLMCWSAGIFRKQPHSASHVSWHQDAVYYGLAPVEHVVRVWVALSPATVENGTMSYARGAHRLGLRPHHPVNDANNLLSNGEVVDIDISRFQTEAVLLEPGEVALHHLHAPHASGANATDEARVNLVITYISPDVRPACGHDSALLVRGRDDHHHFQAETRLQAEFDDEAVAAHARAMAIRRAVFAHAGAALRQGAGPQGRWPPGSWPREPACDAVRQSGHRNARAASPPRRRRRRTGFLRRRGAPGGRAARWAL